MCCVLGNLDDPRGFDRNLSLSASEKRRVRLLVELSLLRARKANQNREHNRTTRTRSKGVFPQMVCLFDTRMTFCIKSSRRIESGSCAPDMVSRPVCPLAFPCLWTHYNSTSYAHHAVNPKTPQQAYIVDASRMSPPRRGTRHRPPEEFRSPPL